MIRKTLTIFSLIGLLISVGLWGVSYVGVILHFGSHSIGADTGKLFATMWEKPSSSWYAGALQSMFDFRVIWLGSDSFLAWRGWVDWTTDWWFPYGEFIYHGLPQSAGVRVPLWIPSLLCGTLLFFSLFMGHRRTRLRHKLGLCLKCGYDLRASKDRCPECGEEFGSTGVAR